MIHQKYLKSIGLFKNTITYRVFHFGIGLPLVDATLDITLSVETLQMLWLLAKNTVY